MKTTCSFAENLVAAILEGESAKDFLKKIGRKRFPFAVDIAEWDELDDWQKLAFKDMAVLTDAGWELANADDPHGPLTTGLAVDRYDEDSMQVSLGHQEWYVYRDEAAATVAARECVKNALDEGILNQDFVFRFVNEEQLRRDLASDVSNSEEENFRQNYRSDEAQRDKLIEEGYLEEDDFFTEDGDEVELTPELEAKIASAAEEYTEKQAEKALADPVRYLQDLFGDEDGMKQAVEIGGIDENALLDAAVHEDGLGSWLASYDGEEHDLDNGAVAFRHN